MWFCAFTWVKSWVQIIIEQHFQKLLFYWALRCGYFPLSFEVNVQRFKKIQYLILGSVDWWWSGGWSHFLQLLFACTQRGFRLPLAWLWGVQNDRKKDRKHWATSCPSGRWLKCMEHGCFATDQTSEFCSARLKWAIAHTRWRCLLGMRG